MGVTEEQGIGPTGIWLGDHLPHRYSPDLVKSVLSVLPEEPRTVRDLGCGPGKYLVEFAVRGCRVEGIEGTPYVAEPAVAANVQTADLTEPLVLSPVDLTLCIEVGEHIPREHLEGFLANVRRSVGRWLVLSWALPDQSGFGHVNCQPNNTVIKWLHWLGLEYDAQRTLELRYYLRNDNCRYLPNTIMVFERT